MEQVKAEPVAWMYELPDGECCLVSKRDTWSHDCDDGWTETPLYTAAAINEAAHQWQDIATAPRDWDDVLVFSPEHEGFNCGGVFSAFYDPDAGKWATHGPFSNIELHPTHWMPLPSPPAIEAHKESQP